MAVVSKEVTYTRDSSKDIINTKMKILVDANGKAIIRNNQFIIVPASDTSEFNSSAFILTGSPVVSSDGILSDSTNGSVSTVDTIEFTKVGYGEAESLEINFSFTPSSPSLDPIYEATLLSPFDEPLSFPWMYLYYESYDSTKSKIKFYMTDENGNDIYFTYNDTSKNIVVGTKYYCTFRVTLNEDSGIDYKFLIGTSAVDKSVLAYCNDAHILDNKKLSIGSLYAGSNTYRPFIGEIPLKDFSVTIDGVTVISGTK